MARILLIEDDPDIRGLMERFLRRAGFAVTAEADGEAGLQSWRAGDFDLIVTDGLLPKKTGFEVAAAVRADPRGQKVGIVMVTAAFRGSKAERDARKIGVDAYFTKPFVLAELKEALVEVMLRYRSQRGESVPPAAGAPPRTATPLPRTRSPVPRAAPSRPAAAAPSTPAPSTASVPPASPPAHASPAPPRTLTPAATPVPGEPFRAAPHTPRSAPPPPPPLPKELKVEAPQQVARVFLACARALLDGVVRLVDGDSQMSIAFLRGVPVGATDNLREHLLGERLWKQGRLTTGKMRLLNTRIAEKGERVAEALLALGYCTADEALVLVDEQLAARLRRALTWTGTLEVAEDSAAAERIALTVCPAMDAILAFGLDPAQAGDAERFVVEHKGKRLSRHPRFEELLLAVARAKPSATLPMAVLAGTVTVTELARSSSPSEVYAAWLAGLLLLPDDPPPDTRVVPDSLRGTAKVALVDRDAAAEVSSALLFGRGKSVYTWLGLPTDAAAEEVLAAVADLDARVGRAAMSGRQLGPAAAAAQELWGILEELRRAFADAEARRRYDEGLRAPVVLPAPAAEPPPAASPPAPPPPPLSGAGALARPPGLPTPPPMLVPASLARPPPPSPPPPPPVVSPPMVPPPSPVVPPPPSPPASRAAGEDAFLEGQASLADGQVARALGFFEVALATRPNDPDYAAYFAWALFLSGARNEGLNRLMGALRAHPQSMRPLFFIAMSAAADGETGRARALLKECVRRAPDDIEVQLALTSMED